MRNFLAWGDFSIPFDWSIYWAKHFYMWSFQSGTPNPDGLIRLPGRIFNFLVFGATNNVGAGYFYLFGSLAVAFVAFWLFARKFLQIKSSWVQFLGALLFALNPIFLGNLGKVGLVLAAAMLPLCLLAIRSAFVHRQFRFLLLYVLCINLSFLHPYTFTVNAAVSGAYLIWMAWQHRHWVRDVWPKFVGVGVFALLLNAYFILPMAATGTVSKDVISTNITPTAVDYTALVGVSNTRDLFTGFSLSKNVFVDFAFYNDTYQNVYFFGVFLFYVILFGLYLYTERRLSLGQKRRLGVFFAGFLVLLLLAATTVAHIDRLIKVLIELPGGWAFRSPLKWQLYIPLALFGMLVILLNHVRSRGKLALASAGLLVTFVLMNGYIMLDVFAKILVPRRPVYFSNLERLNLTGKSVLFVNNGDCMDFMRAYPGVTTELNQIFGSKNTQLKHVLEDNAEAVNLGSYDYVLGCFDNLAPALAEQYHFAQIDSFIDQRLRLYANKAAQPAVAATDVVYAPADTEPMGALYRVATDELGTPFTFAHADAAPTVPLRDVFGQLTPKDIAANTLRALLSPGTTRLHVRPHTQPLYYEIAGDAIILSHAVLAAGNILTTDTIELPPSIHQVQLQATVPMGDNNIPNGSFEQGPWQQTVGDCYDYDDQAALRMRINKATKSAGQASLELGAMRHIACSGPAPIPVTPGQHYLLSFDYQSPDGGKYAGYSVSFDDDAGTTVVGRMQDKGSDWHSFSKELTVPEGAKTLHLLLYAYPDAYGEREHLARYDQVSLLAIPPAQDRVYALGEANSQLQTPHKLTYQRLNPTRTSVAITGASKPFFLTTTESYHPGWQADLLQTEHGLQLPFAARTAVGQHIKLNNTMNAWYIDPAVVCAHGKGCNKQADGSYSFAVVLEFAPQRWFYLGLSISASAGVLGGVYIWYERRQDATTAKGRR